MDQVYFEQVLVLIEKWTGMAPPVSHQSHIRRELGKMQTRLGLDDRDFLFAVQHSPDIHQECIDRATINETYFFREQKHFQLLQSELLPRLSRNTDQLLIWSVSCSTGEEAVSLGVLAHRLLQARKVSRINIIASDINAQVLSNLKSGRFPMSSFRTDGEEFHDKLLQYGTIESGSNATTNAAPHRSEKKGTFILDDSILSCISVHQYNVSNESADFLPGPIDLIFFRNTLLYMAMENRREIIDRIVRWIKPGGYFFLSSSEVPFVVHDDLVSLEHEGLFYFQKKVQDIPENQEIPGNKTEPQNEKRKISASSNHDMTVTESAGQAHLLGTRSIQRILELIHTGRVEEAQQSLVNLPREAGTEHLVHFAHGQLCRANDEKLRAETEFKASFQHTPGFWPARFYYALGVKNDQPQMALVEFKRVLASLDGHTSDGHFYEILDGFNIEVYRHIAENWVRKLQGSDETALVKKGG